MQTRQFVSTPALCDVSPTNELPQLAMQMASPRQKMVVIAQSSEHESRKKRQTLERSKANHLSKQLQMRLQYAKLKVEHGWQRQNLNEVENLYFHHSLRGAQRPPPTNSATAPAVSGEPPSQSHAVPPPPIVPDRPAPSPGATPAASSAPPPSSDPPPNPTTSHTPAPRPPSALDLSDPAIRSRLVQPHTQPTLARNPSSTTITPTPTLAPPTSSSSSHLAPGSTLAPHTQSGYTLSPGNAPLCPTTSQPPTMPIPTTASSTSTASGPMPVPTSLPAQPIAPSALTYDSFWSSHAASSGAARALYRTHTGFTASATPGGNMAMLTPGGHAAVMTSEGVYVGGGTK